MKRAIFAAVLSLTVLVDQATKIWAQHSGRESLNSGISLSFFSFFPQVVWIAAIVVFLIGVAWMGKSFWSRSPVTAGLFFGGAVSNLLDRIVVHGVRDWITWPVWHIQNNLADVAISIGVVLIFVHEIITHHE